MNVAELIDKLKEIDPDTLVLVRVDSEATRTGDYMEAEMHDPFKVNVCSYGGYECRQDSQIKAIAFDG